MNHNDNLLFTYGFNRIIHGFLVVFKVRKCVVGKTL